MKAEAITIEAAGREVRISNPAKLFFPQPGFTKLDLVRYYLECEEAVVRHLRERPTTMKRWVDGVAGEFFFQKRVPDSAPEWLTTATVHFPSGRSARELVVSAAAPLARAQSPSPAPSPAPATAQPPRHRRSAPAGRGAATLTAPTSCASTLTRRPRSPSTRCVRWRCAPGRSSRSTA